MIGARIREIREEKNLSQTDIEKRTGLFRCYISRVENNHTAPSVETLEKFAGALEVPLYELLYDGPNPPSAPDFVAKKQGEWGSTGKSARFLRKLRFSLSHMDERNRELLLALAARMASH
jgi:transcriptional regulator with XRE-family HTH domain